MKAKLQHPFFFMEEKTVNQFAAKFGSPLFIMNEHGIMQRFHVLQKAVKKYYSHAQIAVSYKTNFLKGLLSLLHHEGAYAEVVSGIEYAVAKEIRRSQQRIIFNGPMKTQDELKQAILDNAIINCDHAEEIDRIEQIAKNLQRKVSIGIRIYFADTNLAWSRFGFSVKRNLADRSTLDLIKRIITSPYLKLSGLHSHIGTNIRDMQHFRQLGKFLNHFAINLKTNFNVELEWIDAGGGLAGTSPYIEEHKLEPHALPDANEYARAIITPLLPYLNSLQQPAALFFEPGRTLFEPNGALLTKVVGRRYTETDGLPAVICDAGINMLATCNAYDFPIRVFSEAKPYQRTQLLGPTCNQHDQLHTPVVMPALKANDLLLFYGVGSYCMAFSYSFIRYRPGVILWRGGDRAEWLRQPETLEHNARLEHVPQPLAEETAIAC